MGALGCAGAGEHRSYSQSLLREACLGWYSAEDKSRLQEVVLVTTGSSREGAHSPVTLLSPGV